MANTIWAINVGDKVTGTYVGVPFVGRVASARSHTMNHTIRCFQIDCDQPIRVFGDEREWLWLEVADNQADTERYNRTGMGDFLERA